MMKVVKQPHEITLQHRHRNLPHHGTIDNSRNLEQLDLIDVLKGCHIDHCGVRLHPFGRKAVLLGRHTRDDNRALPDARFRRDGIGTLVQPSITGLEQINRVDVDAVDASPIVRQHRRQWPSHDLASIDHGDGLSLHPPPQRQFGVVFGTHAFQYLHHAQSRAGKEAFLSVSGVVQVPHVTVQIRAIPVTQSLHVAFDANGIPQKIIVALTREAFGLTEYGVVHDDAMDAWVLVGVDECLLHVNGISDASQVVPEAIGSTRFSGPFGVFHGGWVVVGEEAHEEGWLDLVGF
mmetsp:Transcript_49723/g.73936  ORF Transcript_49723/g.73936 Transcript_49723/m.73936 type:complete len:291 (+) Transcript_49723:985-1857(+)